MIAVPRPLNPFIVQAALANAPQLDPSLTSGVPMAQQSLPLSGGLLAQAPRMNPAAPPAMMQPPTNAPQLPDPNAGMLQGMLGANGLGGDAGLAFAAGVLGGGPTNQALARGFGNVLAARTKASPLMTDKYREFALAQSDPAFAEFLKSGGGNNINRKALQTTWMQDANGNWVPGQLTQNGTLEPSQMPSGYKAVPPADVTGARQSATVDAKTAGAARAALPSAGQAVAIARKAIDDIRSSTAGMSEQFGNVMGVPQQWLPVIPKTARADFLVRLEQANGQAFMQARAMLKGGGQITDYEGRRGEAAYSRMQSAAQRGSEDEFLSALDDFEQAVEAGYKNLQDTATGGYAAGAVQDRTGDANGGWSIEEVP